MNAPRVRLQMQPLRFSPIFQRYIWGGRRLHEVLGKPIGDQTCAESWEVVDHNEHQSVVQFGKFSGQTLSELIASHPVALLGERVSKAISNSSLPAQLQNRFPLLLKFLDANRELSVQVHPDDVFGAKLEVPDLGKTEAWYVMHADPGAKIYAGLKEGINEEKFRSAVKHGFTEEALHSFEPKTGDCVFIKAGTMHAIGAGLLIAEIQQCSNTTFRIFDWNRVDNDGNPRPVHIEQGIQATNFELGPVAASTPKPTDVSNCMEVVSCDKFVMNRWSIEHAHETFEVGGDDRFRILAVIKGSVVVENDPCDDALKLGETILLPASLGKVAISANENSQILEIFVP